MPAFTPVGENGVVEYNKIKPFRMLLPARLPKKIAEAYKLHWRPVYGMMEKGVGNIPEELTPGIVNNLYGLGTEHLRTWVRYVFTNDKLHHNDWVIATSAKYLSRSMIVKKGTEEDKQLLPAATYLNRPRAVGLKRQSGANANAVRQDANDGRQRRRGPHDAIDIPPNDDTSSEDE